MAYILTIKTRRTTRNKPVCYHSDKRSTKMIDLFTGISLGVGAVNSVGLVIDSVVLKKHGDRIKSLEGSEGTAAAAYNAAKEAQIAATRANSQCEWLYGELNKQKLLPEKPKSNDELLGELLKSLVNNQTQTNQAAAPQNNTAVDQTKLIADVVAAAVNEAFKKQGK